MKERAGKILLLYLCTLLTFNGAPQLFLKPRLWAEEGQVYLSHAFNHSFFEHLVTGFLGYYSFIPNLATGVAALFPLEYAPYITSYAAFVIQLAMLSIVIFGNSEFWNSCLKKALIVIGVILISPSEAWLNTIHCTFWLSLGTLFVLLEDCHGAAKARTAWYGVTILLGGLTGVVSCFMSPVFLLKARRTRTITDLANAAILSICTLIQAAVCMNTFLLKPEVMESRFEASGFSSYNSLLHFFVNPFFASTSLDPWLDSNFNDVLIGKIRAAGIVTNLYYRPSMVLCLALMLILSYIMYRRYKGSPGAGYLSSSFVLVTVLSTISSLSMAAAPRYGFLPSVMILVALVHFATDGSAGRDHARAIAAIVLIAALTIQLAGYPQNRRKYIRQEWPQWSDEVKRWREDGSRVLQIWPEGWVVRLEEGQKNIPE